MNAATLLLAVVMNTLVLRSGDRIAIAGPAQRANGVVVFRVEGGALYSIPETEVDLDATQKANGENAGPQQQALPRKLKVSAAERDRLIKQLEQSHGEPAELPSYDSPRGKDKAEPDKSADEARWHAAARQHEEWIRSAQGRVEDLHATADRLRDSIRTYMGLGYSPDNFSYLTMQLSNVEAQIPQAEREVERAQRAYDDFREDARKQGILPGWLR